MKPNRTLFLVEVAIFSALAIILDTAPFLSFKIWAQGGSVSFSMIPVFIIAYRWGLKGGLLSGLLFGIMQLFTGAYIMTPLQAFLDYVVAFTVIGFAGVFSSSVKQAYAEGKTKTFITYVTLGALLGSTLRFLAHFFAGIAFYGQWAPEGQPVWLYSLLYNGGYMLPGFILSTIAVSFLLYSSPRVLNVKGRQPNKNIA